MPYCEGGRKQEQVAQRDCGVSIVGDVFKACMYVITGDLLWLTTICGEVGLEKLKMFLVL